MHEITSAQIVLRIDVILDVHILESELLIAITDINLSLPVAIAHLCAHT